MGNDDDRLWGIRIARPGQHVCGGALRQRPAKQMRAVVHVVGHQCGGAPGQQGAGSPRSRAECAREHRGPCRQPGRLPVAAHGGLLLEDRVETARPQHVREQLGRLSLALAGGLPHDRCEPLDVAAYIGGWHVCHPNADGESSQAGSHSGRS